VKNGSILVAHPELRDPDFGRSVILILRHETEGALGLNISGTRAEGASPYEGGPLPLPVPIRMHKTDAKVTTSEVIPGTGYSFCAAHMPAAAQESVPGSIVLTGYAGWGEGQLASEMSQGAWILTTTTLEAILAVPPEQRWKVAAEGAGITVGE